MGRSFDVVVVGAGPGGYAAAIRCAQLGLQTALVEREALGGVCLNLGCIPSKAMLRSAEVLGLLHKAEEFGLRAQGVGADYADVVARRDRVVAQLLHGLTNLLRAKGVTVLRGDAQLRDPASIDVRSEEGEEVLQYESLIVATGSRAAPLSVPGADLPGVIDSDGALQLGQPPGRVVVIGAGAVGVEWAEIWRAFGSEVTILEMLPQLVPTEEPEVARELARAFSRKGIVIHVGAQVRQVRPLGPGLEVVAAVDGGERAFPADTVLVAVGRRPNVEALNLDAAGVQWDRRGIPTDSHMRTNVPQIYAVGDVRGGFLLAHVATHQGIIAAQAIAGGEGREGTPSPPPSPRGRGSLAPPSPRGRGSLAFDETIVPSAIFTDPELASVGLREREATEQGIAVRIGRFPFAASGRAAASGEPVGFVKLVAEESSGRVLGVHIVGHGASDLIGEASLALRMGATLEDLAATIHVHPTFSEALGEAAWAAAGLPLHMPGLVREVPLPPRWEREG
jgi:dihydrolipoamide dehydrogenase